MIGQALEQRLQNALCTLRAQGLERCLTVMEPVGGSRIVANGREYLNLSGNDYLGLAQDTELFRVFLRSFAAESAHCLPGPGSGASRLLSGNHPLYQSLEETLGDLYQQRVLVFNSGYHANSGILPVLAGKDDLILADKLCHASLIDGMRLARAELVRFSHLDYERIEAHLEQKRQDYDQVFVVVESLFSMDGDRADLAFLTSLKNRFDCCLYVDEAHAVGVYGTRGLGLASLQGVASGIDILVGTFGKAWGGQGAFVVCSDTMADFLINTARPLVFTTALPPMALAWLLFVAGRIPAMTREREHLAGLSGRLRQALAREGLVCGGDSHIIPVPVGDSARSLAVADCLRSQGYWISAIRPPTVPPGTARLRLSLSAAMQWSDLAALPGAIAGALEDARC